MDGDEEKDTIHMDPTIARRNDTLRCGTGMGNKGERGISKMARTRINHGFQGLQQMLSHDKAYERMTQTGCHPKIANLVMDLYQGQRRIKVHGAASRTLRAKAGILAGCAFAKDVLKAFLDPIKEVMQAECRDYVDDITIIARGYDHRYMIPFSTNN